MFKFSKFLCASIIGITAVIGVGCTMEGENPSGGDEVDAANPPPIDGAVTPPDAPSAAICGDGIKAGAEQCDQGNLANGDGCSSTCTVETGWSCNTASPNVCSPTGQPWSITCAASTDLERITTGVQWYAAPAATPVGDPVPLAANGSGNRVAPTTATSVTILWVLRWEDFTKGPAWWLAHLPQGCTCNLSWPGQPATQPAYWLAGGEGGFGCNIDGRNRHTLP